MPAQTGKTAWRMRVRMVLLGVVLGRVVRGEERPAVEEQAAGPLAAADDA